MLGVRELNPGMHVWIGEACRMRDGSRSAHSL